jgi:hypothetical protein
VNITELKPGLLVQDGRKVFKVSSVYENRATLQQVLPVPPRTLVRTYCAEDLDLFVKPATDTMVARYEQAWGLEPLKKAAR